MSNLIKRTFGKVRRGLSGMGVGVNLLLHSSGLPENADLWLHQNIPDTGGTCLIDRDADYEVRSLLLSVIVPAYNVEKYIRNCLESILRQKTSFEYEVIIINDGSTDATPVLLENYERHPGIRILNQKNQGLSAARNTGIAHAKGEYLCFVDSDDELAPDALEAMVTFAVEQKAKLVVGSIEHCLRDGSVRFTERAKDQQVTDCVLPGFAWGRIIHYSVFKNLCFPVGYWFEDSIMDQIVHPMCQDATYTISNICYRYFVNEHGITATAKGKPKSLDTLWITIRLLKEREVFGLVHTQHSYEYFLKMVRLTYQRTKYLGVHTAKCVFVMQSMLLEKYYASYQTTAGPKMRRLEEALRNQNFRKYLLACERKRK